MRGAVVSLLRRGLEVGHAQIQGKPDEQKLPAWGAVMLAITVLIFAVVTSVISYVFGRLVPTLIMVESPQSIPFEALSTQDPDELVGVPKPDRERLLVKQQPITASFRTTLRHLKSIGGRRACFRGVSVLIVYTFVVQSVSGIVSNIHPIVTVLAPILASVICAQLSLTWTHIVISDPSPKPWFRRVPSFKTWKKVALPTAIHAVAEELAVFVPIGLAIVYGFGGPDKLKSGTLVNALKGLSVLALSFVLAVFLVIPANVILVRVQASLLADSEETVVPFDRSFGGKVVPEIVGGSGAIGMIDAWTTFDWSARVRLFKAYVKVMAMQMAMSIFFFLVLSCELFLIVGKDWQRLIPSDGDGDKVWTR